MPIIPDDADPSITLICSKCGAEKSTRDYHRKRPGQVMSWCKACHAQISRMKRLQDPEKGREYSRQYQVTHKEKIAETVRRWQEANPEKVAQACRKYRASSKGKACRASYRAANAEAIQAKNAAYRATNAATIKAKNAAYRAANRDLIRERQRAWIEANPERFAVICARANHRRRVRERGVPCTLTAPEWAAILQLQGHACARCRLPFGLRRKPTRDHVIPLAKGGGLTVDNVQALCRLCNCEKYLDDTDYRDFPVAVLSEILA